jgi:hypothetical protein
VRALDKSEPLIMPSQAFGRGQSAIAFQLAKIHSSRRVHLREFGFIFQALDGRPTHTHTIPNLL